MAISENVSLRAFNTFGIDVSARYFFEAGSVADVHNFLDDKKNGQRKILVLGGGSNILFTKNFDGVVLKNNIRRIELLKEDAEHYYVKVGAGEVWHDFVLHCIRHNYAGAENLSLIPGSAGAAPIQNIGAYGVEQKEIFSSLEAIALAENKMRVFTLSDCRFAYRDSIFKNEEKGKYIITSVTFRLNKKPVFNTSYGAIGTELEKMKISKLSIAAISQAVCNIRRSKLPDPAVIGNAGSFFKNPVVSEEKYEAMKKEFPHLVAYEQPDAVPEQRWKLAAGWLIEACGWKGKKFGNHGVHKAQALVLVNYGDASGEEIYELSGKILESVKEKFGVELEREVQVY